MREGETIRREGVKTIKKKIMLSTLLILSVALALIPIIRADQKPDSYRYWDTFSSLNSDLWEFTGNGSGTVSNSELHISLPNQSNYACYLRSKFWVKGAKIKWCFRTSWIEDRDDYHKGIHFSMGLGNYTDIGQGHTIHETTWEYNSKDLNENSSGTSGKWEPLRIDGDDPYEFQSICVCCSNTNNTEYTWYPYHENRFFFSDGGSNVVTCWWEHNSFDESMSDKVGYFINNREMHTFTNSSHVPWGWMKIHIGAWTEDSEPQPFELYIDWIDIQCVDWMDGPHCSVEASYWFSNDDDARSIKSKLDNYWYFAGDLKIRFSGYDVAHPQGKLYIGLKYEDGQKLYLQPITDTTVKICYFDGRSWTYDTVNLAFNQFDNTPRWIRFKQLRGNSSDNDFWKVETTYHGYSIKTVTLKIPTHHDSRPRYRVHLQGTKTVITSHYFQCIEYWIGNEYDTMQ